MGVQYKFYSVYLAKDDSLIILDGTADQCCKAMKLKNKASFYKLIHSPNEKWIVIPSDKKQIVEDMES